MKWIKAKGNYPEKEGYYAGRVANRNFPGMYSYINLWFSGDQKQWDRSYRHSEWLDESTSESIEQPTIDSYRVQAAKDSHERDYWKEKYEALLQK